VLLVRIGEIAEEEGFLSYLIEAPEERRLAGLVVPKLRAILYKLSAVEKARTLANSALAALRNFASAFKVSYAEFGDIVKSCGLRPEGWGELKG